MIGNDRLLDSMSNFDYREKKKTQTKSIVAEDRYIPKRRLLEKNYKMKSNLDNQ